MAYILLLYSLFSIFGLVMTWLDDAPARGMTSAGYRFGQVIGAGSLFFGGVRAVLPRKRRSWIDWTAAGFLMFVAAITLPALVSFVNMTNSFGMTPGFGIVLALITIQIVVGVVVAIRLMRRPYLPPKLALETVFE